MRITDLNPVRETSTVYGPVGNSPNEYNPDPFVIVVRLKPLFSFLTVTVAPGTTAPVLSVTVPRSSTGDDTWVGPYMVSLVRHAPSAGVESSDVAKRVVHAVRAVPLAAAVSRTGSYRGSRIASSDERGWPPGQTDSAGSCLLRVYGVRPHNQWSGCA